MTNTVSRLIVATDGSAINNPTGPAGWAWFVDESRWACGGFAKASNQVAELFAILAVLRAIPNTVPVTIRTDSQFSVNVLTQWLPAWRQKDGTLRKKDGTPPANLALVEELDKAFRGRDVRLEWVKGHSGNMLNEIADKLCGAVSSALYAKKAPPRGPGWLALPAGYVQPHVNAVMAGTRPSTRPTATGPARRSSVPFSTAARTGGRTVPRRSVVTTKQPSFVSWDDESSQLVRVIQPHQSLAPDTCSACSKPINPLTFECDCSR